jgi:hypothetical protein
VLRWSQPLLANTKASTSTPYKKHVLSMHGTLKQFLQIEDPTSEVRTGYSIRACSDNLKIAVEEDGEKG